MLMGIFNKPRSDLYLGTTAVVPRSAIKKLLEGDFLPGTDDLDVSLKQKLEQIFDLSKATDLKDPKDTDLGIDVIVTNYLLGPSGGYIDVIDVPIFWRPKIEVAARVYKLCDGRTVYATRSVKKLSFKEYFSRILSFRGFFPGKRFSIPQTCPSYWKRRCKL